MHDEHIEQIDLYLDFIEACHDATLLRDDEHVDIDIQIECPTSQGFGMSAAGLIAVGRVIHAPSPGGADRHNTSKSLTGLNDCTVRV